MIIDAKTCFTDAERAAIDEAVQLAEKSTAGEIVPVLASRSDTYSEVPYQAAIAFAVLATLATVAFYALPLEWLQHHPWEIPLDVLVPIQAAALLAGYHLALRSPRVARALVPQDELDARALDAAHRAFHELGLRQTRGATAILVYVSLFEHSVVVLADQAIAAHHDDRTWDTVRDLLLEGLRAGRGAEGFTRAIAECGRILKERFPLASDDRNELANNLRVVNR